MNLFNLPTIPLADESTEILAKSGSVRIERIISTGQISDWYEQDETEFVVLLEGNAVIEYDGGKTIALVKGDTLLIESHERHRVSYTSSEPACIWLCIFY